LPRPAPNYRFDPAPYYRVVRHPKTVSFGTFCC
jgi:hypothetical protein